MAVEISQAGPERVQRLVEVLARSFADDPIIRWPFPTDGNHEEQCRELFRILDEPHAETGWLWEAGDAAGVALWIPPDGGERFLEIERGTRDAIDAMTVDGGVRYRAFWDWIEDHLPGPVLVPPTTGPSPQRTAEGEGIGRALVDLGLRVCRPARQGPRVPRDGPPQQRQLLRAAGVPGRREHAPRGGPRLWFMRFDP
jgi:hypothetical protein